MSAMRALVKSSARMRAFGWRSFAIRAVIGSISTPVSVVLSSRASGMRAKKRPVPHPGSRTRPPEKPMRRNARQIAATHEFRGEMRVLGDAREAREFARRGELLEVLPEGVPALREGVLGGSAEEIVRKVARAEGREERETLLLFRSSVPRLLLDLAHQSDRGDVVRRARLPVGREAAGARETEVQRRNNDRRGGVFLGLGDRVVGRLAEGETGIEAHRGGEGGRVEERQAQLVGGRLHCRGDLSGARDRPATLRRRRRDRAHGD